MTDGDRFAALYARHCEQVERYLFRRAPEVSHTDLVADVFLVVWRRLDEVPAEALPWIYGVARRVLANDFRARNRASRLHERLVDHHAPESPDHADSVVASLTVARAFDQLSEMEQEALRLVAWEQLSLSAAAAVMGCGVPAFAMRLSRARKHLRAHMQDQAIRTAGLPVVTSKGAPS